MKREIKFRGKDVETEKWIYGYYTFGIKHRIEWWDGDTWNDRFVIPKTVGQFTGLKDKSGNDIYEGDTVKTIYGKTGVVIYNDERAMFIIHDESHFNEPLYQDAFNCEIIS